MKFWKTMPMPRARASRGERISTRSAVARGCSPASGADEAVQDLREGALARAVFTQQRVNLAAVQAHVGLVVGEHGTVPPGEAAGFEQGLSGRVVHLWSPSETFRPGRGASPPHKRQKRISQVKAFEARGPKVPFQRRTSAVPVTVMGTMAPRGSPSSWSSWRRVEPVALVARARPPPVHRERVALRQDPGPEDLDGGGEQVGCIVVQVEGAHRAGVEDREPFPTIFMKTVLPLVNRMLRAWRGSG